MSVVVAAGWLGFCCMAMAQPLPPPAGNTPPASPAPTSTPLPGTPPAGTPELPAGVPAMAAPFCAPTPTPEACAAESPPAEGCACAECCPHGPQFSIGIEYLQWWTRGLNFPPLVTSGSLADFNPGALNQPHTLVVLDPSQDPSANHSGGRVTLGYGIDRLENYLSLDGSFFGLETRTAGRGVASDGSPSSPLLARPFFNTGTHAEDADPIAIPGIASGTFQVGFLNKLYGADANLRWHVWSDQGDYFVLLFGGRYLNLEEALNITDTSHDLPGIGVAGNDYFLTEGFSTRNQFGGGQFGAEYQWRYGPFTITTVGKVAFGSVLQDIDNSSFIRISEPGGLTTSATNRALYVTANNAGRFTRNRFAVLPESDIQLGIDFNQYVRLTIGYTFLYLNEAARPGDQIDRNVTIQPVGTPAAFSPTAPPPSIVSTGFWAQGLDVGLRFSF
jgi:hypothetical protein